MGRQKLIDALEEDDNKLEFSDELVVREPLLDEESKALLAALQKKNQLQDEKIKDLQQDREQRKVLSYALFGFMCFYMLIGILIVACCGLGWMVLSDKVIITLLTSTLADVIGIFSFVAKYLYHNK
jgi:fatty-acid desaturase